MKIKLPITGRNGFVYVNLDDVVLFTSHGVPFVYLANRASAVELDGGIFTPERYEAMLEHFDRRGYSTIVDATQPGFVKHGDDVVPDKPAQDVAQVNSPNPALEATLAAAGFLVKAPE